MKDVGFRIRVQRDLREQFVEVCKAQDKPAAQVLREFMRSYVAKHKASERQTGPKADNNVATPDAMAAKRRVRHG